MFLQNSQVLKLIKIMKELSVMDNSRWPTLSMLYVFTFIQYWATIKLVKAGEVASYWDRSAQKRARTDHHFNAWTSGQAAAKSMLGNEDFYTDRPIYWFVTFRQQYGLTLLGASFAEASTTTQLLETSTPSTTLLVCG